MDGFVEVEFCDGEHLVPRYLVDLFRLAELDTSVLTYPQAVEQANAALVRHRLNTAATELVADHLKGESR